MTFVTFGEDFRRLREERGLGVNQLGKIAGVSGSAVSRWEKDERYPTKTMLDKVLPVLGGEIRLVTRGSQKTRAGPVTIKQVESLLRRLPGIYPEDVDATIWTLEHRLKDRKEEFRKKIAGGEQVQGGDRAAG